MNVDQYLQKKAERLLQAPKYRIHCMTCTQPDFGCYCAQVKPFDAKISFVVLIHPIEVKRRIATGRMSHQILQNSYFIKGQDYSDNDQVNELIEDCNYHSVILYPGPSSTNLSVLAENEKQILFPAGKKLRIFVVDGTWATARKMMSQSLNLKPLPRICFSPTNPSNFRVRKQPDANCYSTIEAIHQAIELIGETKGFNVSKREHDRLLTVFDFMVERQLDFIRESNLNLRRASYRRESQQKTSQKKTG